MKGNEMKLVAYMVDHQGLRTYDLRRGVSISDVSKRKSIQIRDLRRFFV